MKDLLVQLDDTAGAEALIRVADSMASPVGGHVTGLYLRATPSYAAVRESDGVDIAVTIETVEESGPLGHLSTQLKAISATSSIAAFELPTRLMGSMATRETMTADLFVAPQPHGSILAGETLAEAVLFHSGRPVLFVPPNLDSLSFGVAMVAWKATPQAARAVAEALPLLARMKRVVVVLIDEHGSSEQHRREPGGAVALHLARHGLKAEVRVISRWSDPGAALLNEAGQLGADLIVAGAYGHSRLGERLFGGVTQSLLTRATMPVLVAH